MERLKEIVKELVELSDEESIVSKLQEINKLLLTEYEIRIGENVIQPMWVEAYYYHEKKDKADSFLDINSHRDECEQKNNWRCLYFHKVGRGGIDVCLSNGEYFLSFLIKRSLVNGEWCKQIELKTRFKDLYTPKTAALYPSKKRDADVCNTTRINLARDCYRTAALASFNSDVVKEHKKDFQSFAGANIVEIMDKHISEFKKSHSIEECKAECNAKFGYIPDKVRKILK